MNGPNRTLPTQPIAAMQLPRSRPSPLLDHREPLNGQSAPREKFAQITVEKLALSEIGTCYDATSTLPSSRHFVQWRYTLG